jgi:pyruvate kinase
MALFRDVYPVAHQPGHGDIEQAIQEVLQILWRKGHVKAGDRLIVTMGEKQGNQGGTNTLRLVQLGAQGFLANQAELGLS